MEEKDYFKLKLEYSRLQGEFLGFCEGLMWWELPDELSEKVKEKIKELRDKYDMKDEELY